MIALPTALVRRGSCQYIVWLISYKLKLEGLREASGLLCIHATSCSWFPGNKKEQIRLYFCPFWRGGSPLFSLFFSPPMNRVWGELFLILKRQFKLRGLFVLCRLQIPFRQIGEYWDYVKIKTKSRMRGSGQGNQGEVRENSKESSWTWSCSQLLSALMSVMLPFVLSPFQREKWGLPTADGSYAL